jgi:thiamine pyrophosphate-dependent acetolactate synthase large subunit-like protein
MARTVSDRIVEFIEERGVAQVFGIPGDTIDSLMESLRKQNAVHFVVMRHEEAGAFAASAQAKLTGKLAVCVGCQGPGAIHLLNGLYDAALDHVPVLAITGQIPRDELGTGRPQEINQLRLFGDVAVYNQEVRSPDNLEAVLALAVQEALARKGVAHVSVPSDVMRLPAPPRPPAGEEESRFHSRTIVHPPLLEIKKAGEILDRADRVVILYGEGARRAEAALAGLAWRLGAPLVHTTRSKDILPSRHPSVMGGIGLMGSRTANRALQECDALLVVGSDFAFREYYPEKAPIIQVDIDPARIGRRVPVAVGLVGEAREVLPLLSEEVHERTGCAFLEQMRKDREREVAGQGRDRGDARLHPGTLSRMIGEHSPDDTLFLVDAGTVTVWANNFLEIRGTQRFVWSSNLGSLGFALPAAIGAKFAFRTRPVVALTGDGGFGMLLGDLATAVRYRLPLVVVVFNNGSYQFIEYEEEAEGNPVFGTKLTNPDFVALSRAFGGEGKTVRLPEEVSEAMELAFASPVPFVIDARVNPAELYIPPLLTPRMVVAFAKSQIRSFFAKPSEAEG